MLIFRKRIECVRFTYTGATWDITVDFKHFGAYFPVEESSEFLQPVDVAPPTSIQRHHEVAETKLYPPSNAAYFTYNRVAWKLNIRKEVFSPNEKLSNPLAIHLIFCQIVKDVLGSNCIRVTRDQRSSMRKVSHRRRLLFYSTRAFFLFFFLVWPTRRKISLADSNIRVYRISLTLENLIKLMTRLCFVIARKVQRNEGRFVSKIVSDRIVNFINNFCM